MHYVKGTGFVEVSGNKVCSKRQMPLRLARVYGFENDLESFTRLVIESRVSRQLLNDEFRKGAAQKEGGVVADYEMGKWVPSYYGLKYTVARKTPAGSKESEMDASFKVASFEEAKAEADRRNTIAEKPVHGQSKPKDLPADATSTPPITCGFKVGDEVTFTNDYGVQFATEVRGFTPEVTSWGACVYIRTDAWWHPVKASSLTPRQ